MEKLLEENMGLMRHVAWNYARDRSHYEELIQEAASVFIKAAVAWDTSTCKFSTFLTVLLQHDLLRCARKFTPIPDLEVKEEDAISFLSPDRSLMFKEMVEGLSYEARHVVELLLTGPVEALGLIGTEPPKIVRGLIAKYLREKRRLGIHAAWDVIREIKEAICRQE